MEREQAFWYVINKDYATSVGGFSSPEKALDVAKRLAANYHAETYVVVRGHYLVKYVDVPVLVQEL